MVSSSHRTSLGESEALAGYFLAGMFLNQSVLNTQQSVSGMFPTIPFNLALRPRALPLKVIAFGRSLLGLSAALPVRRRFGHPLRHSHSLVKHLEARGLVDTVTGSVKSPRSHCPLVYSPDMSLIP